MRVLSKHCCKASASKGPNRVTRPCPWSLRCPPTPCSPPDAGSEKERLKEVTGISAPNSEEVRGAGHVSDISRHWQRDFGRGGENRRSGQTPAPPGAPDRSCHTGKPLPAGATRFNTCGRGEAWRGMQRVRVSLGSPGSSSRNDVPQGRNPGACSPTTWHPAIFPLPKQASVRARDPTLPAPEPTHRFEGWQVQHAPQEGHAP